jgi:DNA-binding transcriptional MerR regulator
MSDKRLYSIGEVSKIKNISVKTLRYYHEINLLIPIKINEESGYRYYSSSQLILIDMIQIAKKTNASLKSIKKMIHAFSINQALEFIKYRQKAIEVKQNEIFEIKKVLNNLKNSLLFSDETHRHQGIQYRNYEKRYAFITPLNEYSKEVERLTYTKSFQYLEQLGISTTYVTGTMFQGQIVNESLRPKAIFHLIQKSDFKKNDSNFFVLEAGTYVTLTYESHAFDEAYTTIENYIKEKGYQVKNILEIDLIDDLTQSEKYTSNIQVLIL